MMSTQKKWTESNEAQARTLALLRRYLYPLRVCRASQIQVSMLILFPVDIVVSIDFL